MFIGLPAVLLLDILWLKNNLIDGIYSDESIRVDFGDVI